MNPIATAPLADVITARLREAFDPAHLLVVNESHLHAGHLGDDGTGESHFRVEITARAFSGQSRVARQRAVNRVLADLLATRIHALSLRADGPHG